MGVDVHKRRCKVVEFDHGEIKVRKPIANTREEWLEMLTELPPDAEIGLEVSTAGYFAMSVLEEAGWRERAHWVHTAGIDSNRRQKNDRLDAERLARKLAAHHLDPLPEAWFPPPEIRALRLRARAALLAGLAAHPGQESPAKSAGDAWLAAPGSDPFGAAGQKWLAEQTLPPPLSESIPQIQRLLKFLEEEIEISEKYLQAVEGQFPELALLRTIPGIGPILAPVIWSEIGTSSAFVPPRPWPMTPGWWPAFTTAGTCRCRVPSPARDRAGCAGPSSPPPTSPFNTAILSRDATTACAASKKPNVAKAAIAHSLARCVYGVLKHGCPYREDRWGRKVGALEQEARGSARSTKTVL